jgi:hypothetical protein
LLQKDPLVTGQSAARGVQGIYQRDRPSALDVVSRLHERGLTAVGERLKHFCERVEGFPQARVRHLPPVEALLRDYDAVIVGGRDGGGSAR